MFIKFFSYYKRKDANTSDLEQFYEARLTLNSE